MNEIFKRRLIGLAVLLVLVFIISLLLPKGAARPGPGDVPSTTVALGVLPRASVAEPAQRAVPADESPTPALHLAPALKPAEPQAPLPQPAAASAKPAPPTVTASAKTDPKPVPKISKSASPPVVPPSTIAAKPHLAEAPVLSKPAAASNAVTKPVPAAPPPVDTKPAPGTVWYVQIGSFADSGNSQTTLLLLENIGYRGESTKITSSAGKSLFRVRLGPFPSETVAKQALDKVSRQGYPQARMTSEVRR